MCYVKPFHVSLKDVSDMTIACNMFKVTHCSAVYVIIPEEAFQRLLSYRGHQNLLNLIERVLSLKYFSERVIIVQQLCQNTYGLASMFIEV